MPGVIVTPPVQENFSRKNLPKIRIQVVLVKYLSVGPDCTQTKWNSRVPSDTLMVREKFSEIIFKTNFELFQVNKVYFESLQAKKNTLNKFYLTLLSKAISRFDTKEVGRILNIYSNSKLKMTPHELATFYRLLSKTKGEFDEMNWCQNS